MGRGGGGLRCCIFYIPPVEASSDQCSAVPALLSIVPPPSLPSLLLPPPPLQGLPTQYSTYLSTRPPSFEQDAIRTLIRLLDEDAAANKEEAAPGFRLHIAHLSDAGCLPLIKVSTGSGRPWGNEGEGAAGRTGRAELWLLSLRSG